MKPLYKFLIIFVVIVLGLWIIGRLTGALQYFSVPTEANIPTMKLGDRFFASNLKVPVRNSFICYYKENTMFGRIIATHRLVGLPGDIIQIKNGDLFVNGAIADGQFPITNEFMVSIADYRKVAELVKDRFVSFNTNGDSVMLRIEERVLKDWHFTFKRKIISPTINDEDIYTVYKKRWNADNFGPVTVPVNSYFVLGDNRLASEDSRYSGFVPRKEVVGTVLWK